MAIIKNFEQFITGPLRENEEKSQKKTYSFSELSPEAQEKAIEKNRDWNVEDDWWDPILEGFREDMDEIGFEVYERNGIQFSGFWSQGDGASFTGRVTDNIKFLESIGLGKVPKPVVEDIYITIERTDFRYSHEKTIRAVVEGDSEEVQIFGGLGAEIFLNIQDQCNLLEPKITDWARKRSLELYNDLEEYYTEITSDEYIKDQLMDPNYKFNKEGIMIF